VAYVANIAHHADVGGMVPGSEAAVCRSIFQEGVRLPIVRICKGGEVLRDVFDIIQLNSRTPDERAGDLNAQFASNLLGVRRVQALFERYRGTADEAIEAYLCFTRRRFETAIGKLRPGTYSATDFLDGESVGETAAISLKLTVGGARLFLDFAGSSPQLSWARNIPRQALIATVYTVVKSFLDPDVPANAGYFETIDIGAPEGSLVQPCSPAPVGCRSISCGVLGDVIAAVLSQAMPDRALAGSGPHHLVVFAGFDPRRSTYFVNYETIAGGMGARPNRDGMDAVRVHASGAANLPVEALEHAYPLHVERYALRDSSGGGGTHRGGYGVIRDYRSLQDGVQISLSAERQHVPAPGLGGADSGALGEFVLNPGTPGERRLGSAEADISLPKDAVISVRTPGGGGFGKPPNSAGASSEIDVRKDRLPEDRS